MSQKSKRIEYAEMMHDPLDDGESKMELNYTPLSRSKGAVLKKYGLIPSPPSGFVSSKSSRVCEYFIVSGLSSEPRVISNLSESAQDEIDEDEAVVVDIFLHTR